MDKDFEVKYGEITAEIVVRNLWVAKTILSSPFEGEITMKGRTKEIAVKKLELFLLNSPYKHLDDL